VNETVFWNSRLSPLDSTVFLSYDVEPFLPTVFSHSTSASAYPPSRSQGFLPLNIYFAWTLELLDPEFHSAVNQSAAQVHNAALAEGQTGIIGAPLYPNYAIYDTPLTNMYGQNVAILQSVKAAVDPNNTMGLAGGFKF